MLPLLRQTDIRWDRLSELFGLYVDRYQGRPVKHPDWMPLSPSETAEINQRLTNLEKQREAPTFRIPDRYARLTVPVEDHRTLSNQLHRMQDAGPDVLINLLSSFQLQLERDCRGPGWVTVQFPEDISTETVRTIIIFPGELANTALIEDVIRRLEPAENAMVVTTHGATYGVAHRANSIEAPCTMIDPGLLVEMIGRIYEHHRPRTDDEWSTSWEAETDFPAVAATLDLRRMFLNNAPVLSRTDLENRLAFNDISRSVA